MNIGFERIMPTPQYPAGTSAVLLAPYTWDSQAGIVLAFKAGIKSALREVQFGRCCYCRRQLFDDVSTHIEHFVDKARYAAYTFAIQNLALSCGTCNTQKNGHGRSLDGILKVRAMRKGTVPTPRCSTLTQELLPGVPFPNLSQSFRWVHPHVDKYSSNIQIGKGWIFAGLTRKGIRTIRGARLNALAQVERRALVERLATRGGVLSSLVGIINAFDEHRAKEVAAAAVKAIRRRRKQTAASKV